MFSIFLVFAVYFAHPYPALQPPFLLLALQCFLLLYILSPPAHFCSQFEFNEKICPLQSTIFLFILPRGVESQQPPSVLTPLAVFKMHYASMRYIEEIQIFYTFDFEICFSSKINSFIQIDFHNNLRYILPQVIDKTV